jgi:hypothetical protein
MKSLHVISVGVPGRRSTEWGHDTRHQLMAKDARGLPDSHSVSQARVGVRAFWEPAKSGVYASFSSSQPSRVAQREGGS